jgi:hypothetical protein
VLLEEINSVLANGGAREWLPRAFASFALRRRLSVVETRGFPWTEIDFPEDYWRACTDVLPAITNQRGSARRAGVKPARAGASRSGRTLHHV